MTPERLKLRGFKVSSGDGETTRLEEDWTRPGAELIGALEP